MSGFSGEGGVAVLEARGVGKIYETRGVSTLALEGVDLTIEEGEFSVLAGPSGSGKTTLLNILGALDAPSSGEVCLDGARLADLSAAQLAELRLRKLGFVFQAYNLIPVLSARENVEFVMELQGVPTAERRARAEDLLRDVERIVLADEPTANLDSGTAGRLLDLMERLNRERAVTFLFSSHDSLVIEKARRVVRLRDGRIVGEEARERRDGA
jgi:putative ABC transport system ATP-binding protein